MWQLFFYFEFIIQLKAISGKFRFSHHYFGRELKCNNGTKMLMGW